MSRSFAATAHQLGMPPAIAEDYRRIFGRIINFQHNIRAGDRFIVLYETNKSLASHPVLLFAEFVRGHHIDSATRFVSAGTADFYDAVGANMRTHFLNAPLDYKYISSSFNLHRLDPITHRIQPHNGVDYAAPSGTPIHSIGDGKIIFEGWERGYGRVIKVRYSPHLVGLYAHLSHFAHTRNHQLVKRQQVIGYVGMTGWATGPHLHFGWYVDGHPVNPVTRRLFRYPSISNAALREFSQQRKHLLFVTNQLENQCPMDSKRSFTCTQATT